MRPNILVVDDNEDILTALRILLSKNGFNVVTESDPNRIPVLMKKTEFNLVLLDMNFTKGSITGEEGFKWLDVVLELNPNIVVILITAYGDIQVAVEAMQKGASDFIQKPWDNQKLLSTVFMACDLNVQKIKNKITQEQHSIISKGFEDIIGSSKAMLSVFNIVDKVALTDVNVLITGENGTGKDLVAKAIHKKSLRSYYQFLPVDMGSIPETLFESEMFGYEKGAFTGAEKSRIGRIEAATGGTLFLDEVGNIPLISQPKLLRVLESRELTPLGSKLKKEFDVRLICATNSNIESMVQDGAFREDLLYRINTVVINLPPLRDRKEDIPSLLNHFLAFYSKKYNRKNLSIEDKVIKSLMEYSWPGNVRELRHLVERAVILTDNNILDSHDLLLPNSKKSVDSVGFNLEDIERKAIIDVIKNEDGNLTKAANILGITRATLYRKIEKYGI